jgi:hypothetical protein
MPTARKPAVRKPVKRRSTAHWHLSKEKILLFVGIVLIFAEFVVTEFLARPYHIEYLLAGLALCGTSITGWVAKGDAK